MRKLAALGVLVMTGCIPSLQTPPPRAPNTTTPESYSGSNDTESSASAGWDELFTDPNLKELVDLALHNNQELNIAIQEIYIANNEVLGRSGDYLPRLGLEVGAGADKAGKYTRDGAVDENVPIREGRAIPAPLPNFFAGFRASWEIDIWSKLRNATKSAVYRYLSSIEGRNYMVTGLIAEIANLYYELMALDNQLAVLHQNIELQQNGLEVVRLEKQAARVTELAVKRFEAEVLKNQSHQYEIQQQIVEAENRMNFLVGRFPQPVKRSSEGFTTLSPLAVKAGVPTQLLENRPDVRQAEMELKAAELDVKVARALFYPSLSIDAGIGYNAYQPSRFFTTPASIAYNISGSILAPLLNRRAITAQYYSANALQQQAVVKYERTILNAYAEAANQLAAIGNMGKSYELKTEQVDRLTQSIEISNTLFTSARADYLEVLTTRRDALDSQMELIETKQKQLSAAVNFYQALGGGWRSASVPADESTVERIK